MIRDWTYSSIFLKTSGSISGIGTSMTRLSVSSSDKDPKNIVWKTGLFIASINLWARISCKSKFQFNFCSEMKSLQIYISNNPNQYVWNNSTKLNQNFRSGINSVDVNKALVINLWISFHAEQLFLFVKTYWLYRNILVECQEISLLRLF